MKELKEKISEKLTITPDSQISQVRDEIFYEKNSELWKEVQNVIEPNAGYRTYDFSDGIKKYKKGFILCDSDGEYVSIEVYNKINDLDNLFNCAPGYYKDLDKLEIGEFCNDPDGGKIIRIW